VQFVLQQSSTQFFLHQAFTGGRVLPVRETYLSHDLVNVAIDAFYDDVSRLGLGNPGTAPSTA